MLTMFFYRYRLALALTLAAYQREGIPPSQSTSFLDANPCGYLYFLYDMYGQVNFCSSSKGIVTQKGKWNFAFKKLILRQL